MASSYNPSIPSQALPHRPAVFNPPIPMAVPAAPAGTFAPGTKVQVGNHRVVIEKYLSEGGFAHVYVVRLSKPVDGSDVAVLKRVAVPDKENLANMRTEVETMKKLKGHRHIVTYIDSHASQLKGGGYEVFLLMEYCSGGGLIDFMNTRLQNRLTEPEILKIISDVAQGVACMHYLKPPLLHRDLKVENVLISNGPSSRLFKLCDFGSSAPPRPAATTAAECRLIEDDVQKHTTMQYRSPEMVDVYRRLPIDEKSDIWALGVLLYKLCYYTTPFEDQGQLAILNASFKFPAHPPFSDRLKKLIALMLRANPQERPNIYQVVREVCSMRGTEVPIKDIYATRSQSEARKNQQLPSSPSAITSPPMVGAYKSPPQQVKQTIPEIAPMRRGRPAATSSQAPSIKPSPSTSRAVSSDPFAALDSGAASAGSIPSADEISARFPTLDQFSLLHDRGNKFEFGKGPPSTEAPKGVNERLTNALADEVFAVGHGAPPAKSETIPSAKLPASTAPLKSPAVASFQQASVATSQSPVIQQPTPQRPAMVSTGIQTSPSSSPPLDRSRTHSSKGIRRFPSNDGQRPSSQPRPPSTGHSSQRREEIPQARRSGLFDLHRSKSQTNTLTMPKSPSTRPSLEGRRPSALDLSESINRSKSANARPRPNSVYLESNMDYLREQEASRGRDISGERLPRPDQLPSAITGESSEEETNIRSSLDYLRTREDEEARRRNSKRSSSGSKHSKRASMPSISLTNTKSILAGRFGDAFRRFEGGPGPRTPSPSAEREGPSLTPIAGSEPTDRDERSDDGRVLEEVETDIPEVRRELERRRLSQEEKRVAQAAAEYRQRLAEKDGERGRLGVGGGVTRAASIQNRVKSLLEENGKASPTKTASGYGRYTDTDKRSEGRPHEDPTHEPASNIALRKPAPVPKGAALSSRPDAAPGLQYAKTREQQGRPPSSPTRPASKPSAPPKPKVFQKPGLNELRPQTPPAKPHHLTGQRIQAAKPEADITALDADEWEADFSKRYPSLSKFELVETEIEKSGPSEMRIRDV